MSEPEVTTAAACSVAAAELRNVLTRFNAFIEPSAMQEDPSEYSDLIERLEAIAMLLATMGGQPTEPDVQLRATLETIAGKIGATLHQEPDHPERDQRIADQLQRLTRGET